MTALDIISKVISCVITLFNKNKKNNMYNLDVVFMWDRSTENHPVLYVNNIGERAVVLDNVVVKYRGKQISFISLEESLYDYKLIEVQEKKKIPLHNIIDIVEGDVNDNKEYTFEIVVYTTKGCKFVTKQKYTYEELQYLLFSEAFN